VVCVSQWLYTIVGDEVTPLPMPNDCMRADELTINDVGDVVISCNRNSVYSISIALRCAPGYGNSPDGCAPCALAKARNYSSVLSTSGPFQCIGCSSGSVASSLGSVECEVCQPGSFAISAAMECAPCPAGRFTAEAATSLQCSLCQSGSYGDRDGMNTSTCSGPCSEGYWCGEGSTHPRQIQCGAQSVWCPLNSSAPVPVLEGFYTTDPVDPHAAAQTMTRSKPCPPGAYCDGSGLARPCPPGYATNDTGATSCTPCTMGRFSPGNTSTCEPCKAGTDSPAAAGACSPCMPGRFRGDDPDELTCIPCPAGRYANNHTSTTCALCEAGSYAADAGSAQCMSCSRGTASNISGLAVPCAECGPGRYASSFGLNECTLCETSLYTGVNGSTACEYCPPPFEVNPQHTACHLSHCPANTVYSPPQSKCVPCGLGKTSIPGGLCTLCPINTYTPHQGLPCVSCSMSGMTGLTCSAGLISVLPGFWPFELFDSALNLTIFRASPCPRQFCPGTQLQMPSNDESTVKAYIAAPPPMPGLVPVNVNLNDNGTVFAPTYCSHPHLNSPDNTLCGKCVNGYVPWGAACVECGGANWLMITLLFVASMLVVMFLIRSNTGGDASANVTRALVVVLVYFSQTAAVIAGPMSGWIGWFHISNLGPHSIPSCLAPLTQYEQFLLSLSTPLILFAEVILLGLVQWGLDRRRRALVTSPSIDTSTISTSTSSSSNLSKSPRPPFPWTVLGRGAVAVLVFSYTQVTTAALTFLSCESVGEQRVIFTMPSVSCTSSEYGRYMGLAIAVLIIYGGGLPLLALVVIYRRRKRNMPATHSHSHSHSHGRLAREKELHCYADSTIPVSATHLLPSQSQADRSLMRLQADHSLRFPLLMNRTNSDPDVSTLPPLHSPSMSMFMIKTTSSSSSSSSSSSLSSSYPTAHKTSLSSLATNTPWPPHEHERDRDQDQDQDQDQVPCHDSDHAFGNRDLPVSSTMTAESFRALLHPFRRDAWYGQSLLLLRRLAFIGVSVLLQQRQSLRTMILQLLCVASLLQQVYTHPFASAFANNVAVLADVLLLLLSVLLGGNVSMSIEDMSDGSGSVAGYPVYVQVAVCLLIGPLCAVLIIVILRTKLRTDTHSKEIDAGAEIHTASEANEAPG